ncbi:MAG: nuclear transport factor 2 family protein [Ilumatobacteraceae bacterium]
MTTTPSVEATRSAIADLLRAIESRDLRMIAQSLSPDACWQNVPHAATEGRAAVVSMLGAIVTWSDEVRWEIVSDAYEPGVGRLERVDRFLIDGSWYDVACNGIVVVDATGVVSEVRDDVDLGEWRARVTPALDAMRSRPALDVVRRHLDGVGLGDTASMAADYAPDAVLRRGADVHEGWDAIADYFDTVHDRLAGRTVEFLGSTATAADDVVVRWQITGDGTVTSGRDTFTVRAGRIERQTVELDAGDF